MKKTPPKSALPDPQLDPIRTTTCPTLSHRSNLTYELGTTRDGIDKLTS